MRAKALAIAALITIPASAQAEVVVGWDFSQYEGAGSLAIENAGAPLDTLSANYSALAPVPGVGPDAAAFGTLYFNGVLGSTDVDETAQAPIFAPLDGSLTSNLDAPVGCCLAFDSFTELQAAGQEFANPLAMTATDTVVVVFEADLEGTGQIGSDFELTIAGRTTGDPAFVSVDFLGDSGGGAGGFNFTGTDTQFTLPLTVLPSESMLVTLTLPAPVGGEVGQAILDNVAITATLPEPGSAGLAAALLCIVGLRARRTGAA